MRRQSSRAGIAAAFAGGRPSARHPLARRRHLILQGVAAATFVVLAAALGAGALDAQREKAAPQFLIFGTVFTQQGFALPGAEIQVRRAGEKKVRWRATSDRAGEFAVRVPPAAEYEVTVRAKNWEPQSRKVDASAPGREDLVFRMKPAAEGKQQ